MENPEVFRSLNLRIAAVEERRLVIVCECADEACTERVVISPVEFHEVQRHCRWYVVRPGHELPQIDRVVVKQSAFVVVESEPVAA